MILLSPRRNGYEQLFEERKLAAMLYYNRIPLLRRNIEGVITMQAPDETDTNNHLKKENSSQCNTTIEYRYRE